MSSSRSFRLLLVLVATLLLVAGIAAGVTVTPESSPSGAPAGDRIEASFTLAELYDQYDEWTLATSTELRNVTWTYRLLDLSGDPVGDAVERDGPEAETDVSKEDGVAEVQVRVVGEVPPVENFSYTPAPSFVVASFELTRDGGTSSTIETHEARHYTPESQEARQAIETAQSAIDAVDGNAEAEETLASAVSAYEGENFENAVTLAERAEREATQAQQTQQRNQFILYGVLGLVVLLLVVAGIYWFLNRDTGGTL